MKAMTSINLILFAIPPAIPPRCPCDFYDSIILPMEHCSYAQSSVRADPTYAYAVPVPVPMLMPMPMPMPMPTPPMLIPVQDLLDL